MIEYPNAKALAANADPATRRRLAERADVQPEILYFLAEDAEPEIRATIAANAATPRHADLLLAKDKDAGVRERLAHKIGRLAPDLTRDERAHIRDLTLDVIAILASDRTAKIRQIIAESLKDMTDAPVEVIQRLARDVEIKVAGPILESSPLLSDTELISIIQSKPIQGALEAIARRRRLGMRLTDALVAVAASAPDGVLAVTALLKNHNAEIDPKTMDQILDLAPRQRTWHEPLVQRPTLSGGAIRRLASFVSHALLGALKARKGTDPATVAAVAATVERRLAEEAQETADETEDAAADSGPEPEAPAPEDTEIVDAPVGEAAIIVAIEANQVAAVAAAVARDSGLPRPVVRKILGSASAKAITALAWKAKYSMTLAFSLQTGSGGVARDQALQPRDGEVSYPQGYPLSESEMEWQLELFLAPAEPVNRRGYRRASA
jgi:uncharacterized protein (DUF2336 family)